VDFVLDFVVQLVVQQLKRTSEIRPLVWPLPCRRTMFSKLGVQFLGLGYYTEQNVDGIASFVHCSVLRNGNHTLHQISWGGPSKFRGEGSGHPQTLPAVVAPLAASTARNTSNGHPNNHQYSSFQLDPQLLQRDRATLYAP